MRPVNLYVTSGAVGILRVLVMLWARWLNGSDIMRHAMARQAKLVYGAEPQQSRIRRPMRRVTSYTALSLHRGVFIGKRTLLVSVTLDAGGIPAGG
jgi:hypothetical protein